MDSDDQEGCPGEDSGISLLHPNCGFATLGGAEGGKKVAKASTTVDESDDNAVLERLKSDEKPEFSQFLTCFCYGHKLFFEYRTYANTN